MSNFKNIEKLGIDLLYAYQCDKKSTVIHAEDLEHILQSAQVVKRKKGQTIWTEDFTFFTFEPDEQALLIAITPIKKKTKAEAALELLERLESMNGIFNVAWVKDDMKRILEMKDEV